MTLNEILKKIKGNILIVGHAGVNRIIICHALGISLENIFAIKQDYCCLNIISFAYDSFSIEVLNKV